METTDPSVIPFLIFPRVGIPAPRETTALRALAIPHPDGQPPRATQAVFWFCCACAASGREDPVGLLYDSYHTKCPACMHVQCGTCGLAWGRKKECMIRTMGGLFASPSYIDPAHWECLCGEWRLNKLNEDTIVGVTQCANPRCLGRDARFPAVNMNTVVMNKYGERLGTLDQSTMQAGGPWAMQRRALGDPAAALVAGLRPPPCREAGMGRGLELWGEGAPAPNYPPRPTHPDSKFLFSKPFNASSASRAFHEYLTGYLQGLPFEPMSPGSPAGGMWRASEMDADTGALGEDCLPTPPRTDE